MKKTAVIGMVLAATMSFSAAMAAPGGKGLGERVMETKRNIEEVLLGKNVSFKSLTVQAKRQKQDALVKELNVEGKSTELASYLREDQAKEVERMDLLTLVLATKRYGNSLKEGKSKEDEAFKTGESMERTANAVAKLLANAPAARDRDVSEALVNLESQAREILTSFSREAQENVSKIIEKYDTNVVSGKEAREALIQAIIEVKGVTREKALEIEKEIVSRCKA